ncbi:S8 family serine peptidase [Adhaeribacter pallidiroseus]|uniref:Halolysin n=1 Tax=Adhaeribacter pallidiroseus TaxID=2072847 RepID=A0A369QCG9_9BACT|nr:S8 family serine peptidase [Adhaeribacter pallidiroseus]RDC62591.1 Halolysin [Adhaeribacter pallidiroseus]
MNFKKIALTGLLAAASATTWVQADTGHQELHKKYRRLFTVDSTTLKAPENWFNLDFANDKVPGISTEKAYGLLQNRTPRTVIVAIIDSGIDIKHEDLQGIIWVNAKEVAGNGVDDDKNGYVDDVNGWSFLGGKSGENVKDDTYELTRQYARLRQKFENPKSKKIKRKDRAEYAQYQKIKVDYEKEVAEAKAQAADFEKFYDTFKQAQGIIQKQLGKTEYTQPEVEAITSPDLRVMKSKALLQYAYENNLVEEIKKAAEHFDYVLKVGLNPDYDPRSIVGDDYSNVKDKFYGNGDVIGPDAEHGTHVAGIVGANRKNNLGVKGIADNVKIMPIRAVPNGDERDKDIANAIYYAVDNGAQVINMSFGKKYSSDKEAVDAAMKYAESKGVLLVHAAGNDGEDLDQTPNYPTRKLKNGQTIANWLEIGASSWENSEKFVASFSNYGKQSVDVFAPGVDIYSLKPNQEYNENSGTSMASPVTTGVAALLFSYFPDLTAAQVRDIILKSSVKYATLEVAKPGTTKKTEANLVPFGTLSITGGEVNAYQAVKMAEQLTAQK